MFTAATFCASGGGEAGRVSGCRHRVGPAGGRGVMQGVGGDSSVSHCSQGVTLPGWERERERERESGQGVREKGERSISSFKCVCLWSCTSV